MHRSMQTADGLDHGRSRRGGRKNGGWRRIIITKDMKHERDRPSMRDPSGARELRRERKRPDGAKPKVVVRNQRW